MPVPSPSSDPDHNWRRSLLVAVPCAALAFLSGAWFEQRTPEPIELDLYAYPLLGVLMGLMWLGLLLRRVSVAQSVNAIVWTASAFFFAKFAFLLTRTPTLDVTAEMTETFFWIPALYVLSFFVPNVRIARTVSLAFFGLILAGTALYTARWATVPSATPVLFALLQLNLANLTLLALTVSFIGFKERYARAEVRSETLQRLAYTDLLTSLPNRLQLMQELHRTLDHAQLSGLPVSLLYIDIDGFKSANDTLGHEAGDVVLREIAERLRALSRPSDVVARLTGDEFVVALWNTDVHDAERLAARVLQDLTRPIPYAGQTLLITSSIGISNAPLHSTDAGTLLRQADSAMYQVKHSGKNAVRLYAPELDAAIEGRARLERALQGALTRGELHLHYQPLYALDSARPMKVEALMRWTHPELGVVSPAEFIPVAETSGLIVPLGAWALNEACAQLARWRAQGLPDVRMCVNVAPLQLAHPNFTRTVEAALHASGLDGHLLELEVTESSVMRSAEATSDVLRELRALGVTLAIDDFGTGYSSLSYLRDLPIQTVKVDRSFVRDLGSPRVAPQYALALIEAIVSIAGTLDLDVTAEGIETPEQLALLRDLGCAHGQGYFLARPGPPEQAEAVLRRDAVRAP
ncbi:putative bifunctional diguanylate cyclase/phosphodiesterase [Deinococcus maricopensis]|uniref:Diguanylate cyclase/phosphodiesterase n=1 Tax=Deinococcus maricopensis (strain DSM 21211 / LMG 22137 / NRRL B-23946 / LB-34) TaxID=709986 RepID=E8U9M7_DEIML|nr:EAL domain-containing protein [Deinococcus maricopensis]ADV67766.1 diguanylate cyclase/phosphodiesterase [Deinococcus maricopensis DSM 21211]